jgi:hypothetical protein
MKKYFILLPIALMAFATPAFASNFTATIIDSNHFQTVGNPTGGTYSFTCPDASGLSDLKIQNVPQNNEISTAYTGDTGFTITFVTGDIVNNDELHTHMAGNDGYGYGCSNGDLIFTCVSGGCASVCSPSTISHGTIGAYPGCAVSCNSGYTLSAGSCISTGGGGSSNPQNNFNIMGISLATGTAALFLANAASTVGDPGVLEVVALAVGIPLAFYILHQLIGLVPKGKSGRRS